MFAKNVNITNTSNKNVYVLSLGTCALSSSDLVPQCIDFKDGKELYSRIVFNESTEIAQNQILKTNTVSMIQYEPSSEGIADVPLFITTYIINSAAHNDQLWLLYCFDIFCNSQRKTFYKVRDVATIDYPQIILPTTQNEETYLPKLVFFENSTSLMVMSCNYGQTEWNCTDKDYNHPTLAIVHNDNFETASMQIDVAINPTISSESVLIFSQVMDKGGGGGIFNGSIFVNCQTVNCKQNYGLKIVDDSVNSDIFSTYFDFSIFVIMACTVSLVALIGVMSIYRFISPMQFIAKYVRNAYLAKVSLDSTRIKPKVYWFFFANLICSAMCIIPWFAYFDYDFSSYAIMIIPPFVPIVLTLWMVLMFHTCPLTNGLSPILVIISVFYWLALIFLSYSFSFVWTLESQSCQTSDLSGLKMVILSGHIATCLVIFYLLFWNIRCFQALKLASPQSINTNVNRNYQERRKIIPRALLDGFNDTE